MSGTFAIPVIETERLRLRGHEARDFDAYAAFWAGERSASVDGPFDRTAAWDSFLADAGQWLIRGFGQWIVEEKSSGSTAGWVGFYHPDRYEETELGWVLVDGFEGKGLAAEGARAALAHGRAAFGIERPVSYIKTRNTRSVALAERLGAVREDTRDRGDGPYHVYRHPAEEAA